MPAGPAPAKHAGSAKPCPFFEAWVAKCSAPNSVQRPPVANPRRSVEFRAETKDCASQSKRFGVERVRQFRRKNWTRRVLALATVCARLANDSQVSMYSVWQRKSGRRTDEERRCALLLFEERLRGPAMS